MDLLGNLGDRLTRTRFAVDHWIATPAARPLWHAIACIERVVLDNPVGVDPHRAAACAQHRIMLDRARQPPIRRARASAIFSASLAPLVNRISPPQPYAAATCPRAASSAALAARPAAWGDDGLAQRAEPLRHAVARRGHQRRRRGVVEIDAVGIGDGPIVRDDCAAGTLLYSAPISA